MNKMLEIDQFILQQFNLILMILVVMNVWSEN
jgi:hypothetical protein